MFPRCVICLVCVLCDPWSIGAEPIWIDTDPASGLDVT